MTSGDCTTATRIALLTVTGTDMPWTHAAVAAPAAGPATPTSSCTRTARRGFG
ncbi:hypothetical protein [Streptomyces sp. NPDC086023]|uniref:hypothetical protein n=1 Tax=Streptomyces sp. NPDC086023 TaxID=3365746 RepID=UPI0037D9210F